jgi:hypothetical protein
MGLQVQGLTAAAEAVWLVVFTQGEAKACLSPFLAQIP